MSRAFRFATRTADGPMSTPLRPAPRSSGTPMIAMCEWRMTSRSTGILACKFSVSWPCPVKHPGERDRLPDVFQSAHPGDEALDTHSEPSVWHRAVLAEIDIPVERLARKLVLFQTLQQQIEIVDTLAAADDLAVSFGRNHVHTQRQLGTIGIGLEIESLHLRGVAVYHQRAVEALGDHGFVRAAEIAAPLDFAALLLQNLHRVVVTHAGKRSFHAFELGGVAFQGCEIRATVLEHTPDH